MVFVVSILLVAFFLLMNAFFVVAEFSLVRVRKSQIDILVEEGALRRKALQKRYQRMLTPVFSPPAGHHACFSGYWLVGRTCRFERDP